MIRDILASLNDGQDGLKDAPGVSELAKVHSPSDTSWKRLLWYVLAGSRGGTNRGRIINLLRNEPRNVNQLAEALDVHYRVAEQHVRALEKNNLIAHPENVTASSTFSPKRWKPTSRYSTRSGQEGHLMLPRP